MTTQEKIEFLEDRIKYLKEQAEQEFISKHVDLVGKYFKNDDSYFYIKDINKLEHRLISIKCDYFNKNLMKVDCNTIFFINEITENEISKNEFYEQMNKIWANKIRE